MKTGARERDQILNKRNLWKTGAIKLNSGGLYQLTCIKCRSISTSSTLLGDKTYSKICITVIRELGVFIQGEGRVWRYIRPDSGGHNTACSETLILWKCVKVNCFIIVWYRVIGVLILTFIYWLVLLLLQHRKRTLINIMYYILLT